jgi:DNA polymerase-1
VNNIWGFDIETNQLSPFKGEPAILSAVLWQPEGQVAHLLDHPLDQHTTDSMLTHRIEELQSVLGDPTKTIVGHNLVLFDVVWWEQLTGERVRAQLFDTRVAQALIDENSPNSLAALVERYLDEDEVADEEMKKMRARLEEVNPEKVLRYNIDDSRQSYLLYRELGDALVNDSRQFVPLFETYMQEYRTLADMTLTGVMVDEDWVTTHSMKMTEEGEKLNAEIQDRAGMEFNIGSSKQLAKVLYDDLRFPVVQQTPGGFPSTSAPALRELRQKMVGYKEGRQFLDMIIRYREVLKMKGTYLDPYLTKHRGNDGRIHPTIYIGRGHDGGTRTGRLSMSNPNLQNVPRDVTVKGSFVPTEGMLMFDADYAQVELRVAAFLAEEDSMLQAFADGLDIHTATLAEIEGLPYLGVRDRVESGDAKWKKKRAEIKAVNFLILYGGGPYQLVSTLRDMGQKTSLTSAKDTIDRWFKRYWKIAEWIESNRRAIITNGGATNLFGQVRHLPGADFDSYVGQKALRQGINFLVQSVAAKLALLSLPPLSQSLQDNSGRLLLTVHDSIVGEYPADANPDIIEAAVTEAMSHTSKAKAELEFGVDLTNLPLAADVKLGMGRWG